MGVGPTLSALYIFIMFEFSITYCVYDGGVFILNTFMSGQKTSLLISTVGFLFLGSRGKTLVVDNGLGVGESTTKASVII